MIEQLDKQIADLEARLAELRRQKLAALQAQVAALQASITGGPAAAKAAPAFAAKAPRAAKASSGPGKRGRRPGKRVPEEALLEQIRAVVASAGAEGVSAREVSNQTSIFYPKVIKLMKKNFKSRGKGKWTRYSMK